MTLIRRTPRRIWRRLRASVFMSRLPRRFPGYPWEDFIRVCRVFSDDEHATLEERAFLFRLAADLPPDSAVIEIGSWGGISTCYLAAGLRGPGATVHAVDSFQGLADPPAGEAGKGQARVRGPGALFRIQARRLGLAGHIRLLPHESAEAVERIGIERGSAAMVFFDGDHAYEGCRSDFDRWLPFLAPGGVVAIHDFGTHTEVTRAVFEAILGGRFRDVIGQKHSLFALRV